MNEQTISRPPASVLATLYLCNELKNKVNEIQEITLEEAKELGISASDLKKLLRNYQLSLLMPLRKENYLGTKDLMLLEQFREMLCQTPNIRE